MIKLEILCFKLPPPDRRASLTLCVLILEEYFPLARERGTEKEETRTLEESWKHYERNYEDCGYF